MEVDYADLRNIEASRYLSVAGVVMLLYDHILTFPDEVELIWKARWTTPKTLFLILRYCVPPSLIIHLHQFSGISSAGLSDSFCKIWFSVSAVIAIITMAMTNFLVILHLWNLWHRNKRLIYSTCLLYLSTQLAHLICVGIVIATLVKKLTFDPHLHCCMLKDRGLFVLMWVPGLAFEIIVCALVAYMSLRTPYNLTRLSAILNRDGLIFYLILVFFRSINVILALKAKISLIFLCVFFICAAATTTVTRMILRLRRISVRRHSGNDGDEKDGCSSLELKNGSTDSEEDSSR